MENQKSHSDIDSPQDTFGRFMRTAMITGKEGIQRLAEAHVTVAGLGAVGSFALEALVRLGIGSFTLIDFDVITQSNFNRQLFALESTKGRLKTEVAAERIKDINPECRIAAHPVFISSENIGILFSDRPDIVVDAIDGLTPKITLLAHLAEHGIPVISSMGAARKTDPAAIRTGDLFSSSVCPLALRIRKRLRKAGITSGIRCVYSVEPPVCRQHRFSGDEEILKRGRKREPMGSLPFITGMFGFHIACEIFRFFFPENTLLQ